MTTQKRVAQFEQMCKENLSEEQRRQRDRFNVSKARFEKNRDDAKQEDVAKEEDDVAKEEEDVAKEEESNTISNTDVDETDMVLLDNNTENEQEVINNENFDDTNDSNDQSDVVVIDDEQKDSSDNEEEFLTKE